MLRRYQESVELRHLRYFVAVAEELHFGRAAKRLRVSQPPLSRQIRSLEDELGVRLFCRTKREVRLTEPGRMFLKEAYLVLEQQDRAVEVAKRAGKGEVGRLAVGFISTAACGILPEVLRLFGDRRPDVELELRESVPEEQIRGLLEGRLHFGFLRPPVNEGGLALEPALREPVVAALPAGHRLSEKTEIPLGALANERFIIFPRHVAPAFYDDIVAACRRSGVGLQIVQEAVRQQTIVNLVAAGIGVALIPQSIRNLRSAGVAYATLEGSPLTSEISVAYRPDDESPAAHAFLETAREVARSHTVGD
jgi:DNA-binding transcriptional LysR family regulator